MSLNGPRKPLKRGPVKRRNAKRANANWSRAFGSAERVAFVQALPCAACGRVPSENAHASTGGMGRRADACHILPLCHDHHALQHTMGARSFADAFDLDLSECAARVDAAWLASQEAAA